MTNPAPSLRWILRQLTKAEWVLLLQEYSGLTGTPPDPPQGTGNYRPLALTAHWEFKGYLASPYFASPTTQHQILKTHEVLFLSLGARNYLAPAISDPTRLEKLVRGCCLDTPNLAPRGVVRGYAVKQFRAPNPTGFYRVPSLQYKEGTLELRLYYDNPASPGNDTSSTSVSDMVAAIMRLPEGHRAMFVSFLGFKCELPGSEITTGYADGHLLGGWPGWWMDNLVTAMEDDTLPQVTGTHQNIGPLLDQMLALGLELDYWISDEEFTFNPDDYKKFVPYYSTSDAGGYRDANGRYWYEDLYNRTITDKVAWAAEYNCPNLSPSSTPPTLLQMSTSPPSQYDTARYRQLCQAVFLSQRKQISEAFESVIRSRLPNITWLEYDDTIIAGMDYPSVDYRKRFGGFPGASAAASDRVGRNRYTTSSDGKMRLAAASGSGTSLTTTTVTNYVRVLHDVLSIQSNLAGATLPMCCWIGPDAYDTGAGPPGIANTDPLALAHCEAVVFSGSDPLSLVWFKTAKGPPTASQDILAQAHANVETALYGKIGTPLGNDVPRTGWNTGDPLANSVLTTNASGVSTIVTQSVSPTGTVTYSERENILNWAPEWVTVTDESATISVAYSRTVTATSPTYNTIAYSIVSGPAWLSIDSETGELTGTPTSSGAHEITLRATDDDALQPLSADETYTLTVSGAENSPPTIDIIAPKSVNEGSQLSFTVTAEDPEDGELTFTLTGSPPSGAAITTGGAFTWTPTEAQGPGFYTITVQATDAGDPPASATRSFQVTVNEVNVAPTLDAISNVTIDEHQALSVTPTAADADVPAQTLVYDLTTAPSWITVNAATGEITGTPDATKGGSAYNVTLRVRDSGSPQQSASRSFTVTVREKNTAPVLTPIGNQGATRYQLFSYQCSATDGDDPAQTLTFTLGGSPPSGLTITSNGLLRWTPTAEQVGAHSVTVVVTDDGDDNGTPNPLTDSETFTLTVAATNTAPVLLPIPNQSVNAGQALSVQCQAYDPDGDPVTFSLGGSPPTGAEISAAGLFTWTPTDSQGSTPPIEYQVLIVATDQGPAPLASSQAVTIAVSAPVANPPALTNQDTWEAYPGETFTLKISAAAGQDGDTLIYTLISSPVGDMHIDPDSGVFTWTPERRHEGRAFLVVVQVSDDRDVPLTDATSFYVSVRRRITVQGSPTFSPSLFTGGEPATQLRRPRRWR